MPDYLCCGSCHSEFEVTNFSEFIQHKTVSCSLLKTSQISTEFLLECTRCLKKFKTPWPLLSHLQEEHKLNIVRSLVIPQPSVPSNASRRTSATPMDDTNLTDVCTQTARSCLKRLVCPYEENLPEDCCLKATKAQRESDKGCCCIDSHAIARNTRASTADKKADCCLLAVPKKRRLLEAEKSTDSCCQVRPQTPDCCKETKKSNQIEIYQCCKEVKTTVKVASTTECLSRTFSNDTKLTTVAACPCPTSPKVPTLSTESQTDFVVTLDFDVDMLLDGPLETDDLTLDHLVSKTSMIDSHPHNSMQTMAPSKAIQTYSRVQENNYTPSKISNFNNSSVTNPNYYPVTINQPFTNHQTNYLLSNNQMVTNSLINSYMGELQSEEGISYTSNQLVETRGNEEPKHGTVMNKAKNKESKFKCNECPRTYKQNVHLRKHVMAEHTKNKPHKCTECDYTTVEKSHLTVHYRKHTGERPFKCRDCDYSTAQNCTLKAHYLRKHPGSSLNCPKCGQSFVTDQEQEKHLRSCNENQASPLNSSLNSFGSAHEALSVPSNTI